MEGRMDTRWAQQHAYSHSFYNHEGETCQNPHCGVYGIKNIFVLRHNLSGETVHIGEQCYGRWRSALGLPVGLRHQQYLELLKKRTYELDGRRLSPAELVRLKREHEDNWLKREAEEGKVAPKDIPLYWHKVLRRKSRIAWCQRQVKEGKLELEPFYQPMGNFRTVDEADKWAEEHGGYCGGVKTWQRRSSWLIYINPDYRGEY